MELEVDNHTIQMSQSSACAVDALLQLGIHTASKDDQPALLETCVHGTNLHFEPATDSSSTNHTV